MVFLFLRRESAAQLKLRAKDAASVDDADIAAVEALLQVVTDEDEDEAYTYEPRSPRHTARSVTFDFEIKVCRLHAPLGYVYELTASSV